MARPQVEGPLSSSFAHHLHRWLALTEARRCKTAGQILIEPVSIGITCRLEERPIIRLSRRPAGHLDVGCKVIPARADVGVHAEFDTPTAQMEIGQEERMRGPRRQLVQGPAHNVESDDPCLRRLRIPTVRHARSLVELRPRGHGEWTGMPLSSASSAPAAPSLTCGLSLRRDRLAASESDVMRARRAPDAYRAPMNIRVWLTGDDLDLDYLSAKLATGDVQVRKEGDKYYLTASSIDVPPAGVAFNEEARRLVNLLNGIARLRDPACPAIDLAGSYTDEDGNVTVSLATATLQIRTRLTATAQVVDSDGNVRPPAPPVEPKWIEAAACDPEVAEVLDLVGRAAPLGFEELYKLDELIKRSGKLTDAMKTAGITDPQRKLFKHTANSESRHAAGKVVPPTKPMPINQARAMMMNLTRAWLATYIDSA